MGRPKATLPFGTTTILEHLIAELRPAFDDVVIVSAPRHQEPYPIEDLLKSWEIAITLVRDEMAFAGPVPALISGLHAARHSVVFVCSCDLPLLQYSVARMLVGLLGEFDAVVPVIDGREQPLCAAYRRSCADTIEKLLNNGEQRLTAIVQQLHIRRVDEAELRHIDSDLHSFFNVNTPEEYARALKLGVSA
jgi:molybdopterin-guanine dinucleotide biosynthesis protein A